jgi:predicted phosphoribosyltransferase
MRPTLARPFRNRTDAGKALAAHLMKYAGQSDVLVLALPRGGVPVAYEVATAIGAPLDVFVVRKLGMPGHEEYAIGAVASGGVRVMDDEIVRGLAISPAAVEQVAVRELAELRRRERAYRGDRPEPEIAGRTIILIDDGLATGSSMRAAVRALLARNPARIVVAVPIAARDSCAAFEREVDEVVCVVTPEPFHAVGLWYEDFGQTSDREVHELLDKSREVHDGRETDGRAPDQHT